MRDWWRGKGMSGEPDWWQGIEDEDLPAVLREEAREEVRQEVAEAKAATQQSLFDLARDAFDPSK